MIHPNNLMSKDQTKSCFRQAQEPKKLHEAITNSNREYYDSVWNGTRLTHPSQFNTWPILSSLAQSASNRLEVGPGLRPRLPIVGTHFIDISPVVVKCLSNVGGFARLGDINALPYPDQCFDLVCAFDVIEHVSDDGQAFSELSRVLKVGGVLVFSVPLNEGWWTEFDEIVGHCRRFHPERIIALIYVNCLTLEKSAVYGMMPRSRWIVKLGMWLLMKFKRLSLGLYDRFVFPLVLRFQKRLSLVSGLVNTAGVDSVLFLCRQTSGQLKKRIFHREAKTDMQDQFLGLSGLRCEEI